jgi:hypothetical protein
MQIISAAGGWNAKIYGFSGAQPPGDDPESGAWGPQLGGWDGGDANAQLSLTSTKPSQYYLIWFTRLATEPVSGGYDVEVKEVKLSD